MKIDVNINKNIKENKENFGNARNPVIISCRARKKDSRR